MIISIPPESRCHGFRENWSPQLLDRQCPSLNLDLKQSFNNVATNHNAIGIFLYSSLCLRHICPWQACWNRYGSASICNNTAIRSTSVMRCWMDFKQSRGLTNDNVSLRLSGSALSARFQCYALFNQINDSRVSSPVILSDWDIGSSKNVPSIYLSRAREVNDCSPCKIWEWR